MKPAGGTGLRTHKDIFRFAKGRYKARASDILDENIVEVRRMIREGASCPGIGARFECSASTVEKFIKRRGLHRTDQSLRMASR
jgi:transposase